MDVTVIVGTFGNGDWRQLGALTAHYHQAIHIHAGDLAAARNIGAGQASTEWLVFLDAGDTLTDGYLEAMDVGTGDLRAPALEVDGQRIDVETRDITHLNPCCIGTAVRREMFIEAGGFLAEPIYEDWSLWLRCVRLGATIEHIPGALYVATQPERNAQPLPIRKRTYSEIRAKWAA